MATGSIFSNVNIKGKRSIRNFVKALENAHNLPNKKTIYSKQHSEIQGKDIKTIFGENNSERI